MKIFKKKKEGDREIRKAMKLLSNDDKYGAKTIFIEVSEYSTFHSYNRIVALYFLVKIEGEKFWLELLEHCEKAIALYERNTFILEQIDDDKYNIRDKLSELYCIIGSINLNYRLDGDKALVPLLKSVELSDKPPLNALFCLASYYCRSAQVEKMLFYSRKISEDYDSSASEFHELFEYYTKASSFFLSNTSAFLLFLEIFKNKGIMTVQEYNRRAKLYSEWSKNESFESSQKLIKLISNDKMKLFFDNALSQYKNDTNKLNRILSLKGRYSELLNREVEGLVSRQDYLAEINTIRKSAIQSILNEN